MTADAASELAFDSLFNVRDLGGYVGADGAVLRRGRLYRADGVHRAAGADLERLASLGLRTVIDLRTHGELEIGRLGAEELGATWHHAPVMTEMWDPDALGRVTDDDAVPFLVERYVEMTDDGAEALAHAITVVADPSAHPALFHCAAGKDRTGVLAALVLALLGVDDAVIADDYARSAAAMQRAVAWFRANDPRISTAMTNQPKAFMGAPREAMLGFLHEVEQRYGSPAAYVRRIGVAPDAVDALRASLLERRAA